MVQSLISIPNAEGKVCVSVTNPHYKATVIPPFGVSSGPETMVRLMEAALTGLAWDVCMTFLDDLASLLSGEPPCMRTRVPQTYQRSALTVNLAHNLLDTVPRGFSSPWHSDR